MEEKRIDGSPHEAELVSNQINHIIQSTQTQRLLFKRFTLPPSPRERRGNREKLAWPPEDSPHSFSSHLIKVGGVLCCCPVCSQVTPPHVICQNDHEIWFLASRFPTEVKIDKRIKTSSETHHTKYSSCRSHIDSYKNHYNKLFSYKGPTNSSETNHNQ